MLPQDLTSRLRRSPSRDLKGLVASYGRFFGLPEVRQLLLNPFVDEDVIAEVATIRTLCRVRTVQAALARHHRTPEPVAMRFLPHLFWRELLEVTVDIRIRASVRGAAERQLLERLPRLTAGEKIALARRAVPSTSGPLIRGGDSRVLAAVLDNPRTTEEAIIPLLRDLEAAPQLLRQVAAHRRWGTRYEVRVALCRNPQTPFADIRRLLPSLRRDDLLGVAMVSRHSTVVRGWVEDELARTVPPDPTSDEQVSGVWTLQIEDGTDRSKTVQLEDADGAEESASEVGGSERGSARI